MIFNPQRYKIEDKIGEPFIDEAEINEILHSKYSAADVDAAISAAFSKTRLNLAQVAALLTTDNRSAVLAAAERLKKEVYGNRIVLFAPLYVGNLCSNGCDYCAFRASNAETARKTLSDTELDDQIDALAAQGHKRLILVYGEHSAYGADFIADNVRRVYGSGKIRRVNINAAPMSVADFEVVRGAGIGTYQIFQETYNRATYAAHHLSGKKADYNWRLTSLDRAMEAGIDDVGLGALLGLHSDWREEILSLIRHTNHLEACFGVGPHTISFPRITRALGASGADFPLSDADFVFAIAVLRLAVPYTGLILTAREGAAVRDAAIAYGVSQIDGGTKLAIGAYSHLAGGEGEAQFTINDNRSLGDVIETLIDSDRLPSFCTACYRTGRTGEHFMEFSTRGFIKRFCTPNAILTLAEYLQDYATAEVRAKGYALIESELLALEDASEAAATPAATVNLPAIKERLLQIRAGARDLYF